MRRFGSEMRVTSSAWHFATLLRGKAANPPRYPHESIRLCMFTGKNPFSPTRARLLKYAPTSNLEHF
jgi:hypothetical protein